MAVTPSPIAGSELDANIYHAHATLPENETSYSIALHLRHLFTTQGRVSQHVQQSSLQNGGPIHRLLSGLGTLLNRFLQTD